MIAVLQRVSEAAVYVDDRAIARIGKGYVVLVGALQGDEQRDVEYLAKRIRTLRVFADGDGKMNLSLGDTGGQVLLVSQFTLAADTRKGRRPSFVRAMPPEEAEPLLERLAEQLRQQGVGVETGVFGAHMHVALVNDGPVTILLDSWETRRGHRREPAAEGV